MTQEENEIVPFSQGMKIVQVECTLWTLMY